MEISSSCHLRPIDNRKAFITQETKEKALAAFLKDPYWKGIYDNAPAHAKKFYEIVFANSENLLSREEHVSSVQEIYKQFKSADWDYVIEHTQNQMAKWGYKKAREKFGKTATEDIKGQNN